MGIEIKITAPDGRYSIITLRDQEYRFADKINHISSTELQPYIAANFSADGICVGGRTMQSSLREYTLRKAREAGLKIEEIDHA